MKARAPALSPPAARGAARSVAAARAAGEAAGRATLSGGRRRAGSPVGPPGAGRGSRRRGGRRRATSPVTLARSAPRAARPHARFGTAVLTLPDGERLDVASTRRETYAHAGRAARRSRSRRSIEEDLARRDFTVNAMALALSPGRRRAGRPVRRRRGPRARDAARAARRFLPSTIRPARCGRCATRTATVSGWTPRTRRAIARAVEGGAFDRVSGDRLRRELVKLLEEPRRGRGGAAPAASRARPRDRRRSRAGAGSRRAPAPAARRGARAPGARSRLARVPARLGGWRWALRCRAAERGGPARARRRRAWRVCWRGPRRGGGSAAVSRVAPVSEIARRIAGLSPDELARGRRGPRLARTGAPSRTRAGELGAARPFPRGADLLAAGVAPGAAIGRALARTRDALLDGRISRREALAFALRAARRARGGAGAAEEAMIAVAGGRGLRGRARRRRRRPRLPRRRRPSCPARPSAWSGSASPTRATTG